MAADPQLAYPTIVEWEFRVLQALCLDGETRGLWERAIVLLADYRFRKPLHQLVFDSLRALPPAPCRGIRAALVRRLTTLGFPDVDVDPFFRPHAMSFELALSIMEKLARTAGADPGPKAGLR